MQDGQDRKKKRKSCNQSDQNTKNQWTKIINSIKQIYIKGLYIFNQTGLKLFQENILELVPKELNHLAAILHVYAGVLKFMK